jgi:hypothetical protein
MADSDFTLRRKVQKPTGAQLAAQAARQTVGASPPGRPRGGAAPGTPPPAPQGPALPFRPGELVLSDLEKQDLKALNYKAGDPLPGDLAERLTAGRQRVQADVQQGIAEAAQSGKVLKLPQEVPFEQLPPEHQASIRQSMQEAQHNIDLVELQREQLAALGQLDPSVRQAVMAAQAPQAPQAAVELFDSRPAAPRPQPHFQPEPPPAPVVMAPPAPPENAPAPAPENRPKPTAGEILAFGASWWDGVPFLKIYEFFEGKVRVTFRTASTEHLELCFSQVSLDQASGRIAAVEDLWRYLRNYRLLLGLQQVSVNGRTYNIAKEVDAILQAPGEAVTEAGGTPLPYALHNLMTTAPFSHESLWRVLIEHWQKFNALVMELEKLVTDQSFSNAIGA